MQNKASPIVFFDSSLSRKFILFVVSFCLCVLFGACHPSTQDARSLPSVPTSIHRVDVLYNQLGFSTESPKSAVVRVAVSSENVSLEKLGATFEVLSGDKVVLSAPLQLLNNFSEWNQLGGENPETHLFTYFSADFTSIKVDGMYQLRIKLGDKITTSGSFSIAKNLEFSLTAPAVIHYFFENRFTDEKDKSLRVFDQQRRVNVWGGWMDAGGDTGKYLSHLSYANFMNPQQAALVTWSLAKSYRRMPQQYRELGIEPAVTSEVFWGADYLHRILDKEGYFYLTIFDGWGSAPERLVAGYEGLEGRMTKDYQAAFREGGGMAIAALASAAQLSHKINQQGEFSGKQYLADAERAFAYLQKNNRKFCDNGRENIIDDYTALIAATELFKATKKATYLKAARERVSHLNQRITPQGWFISDGDLALGEPLGQRPYYHGVEAGLPLIALVNYLPIEDSAELIASTKKTLASALNYQITITNSESNPFGYAKQSFKTFKDGVYGKFTTGFFMPHANESGYWWQGESARLASLSAASLWTERALGKRSDSGNSLVAEFAQHQMDWILGRNPYSVCQLYGFGAANPPFAESAGARVKGGISNGITGATASEEGRGITWAEGPDENNWRWVEQWLPHSAWFLLAVTAMSEDPHVAAIGEQ